MQQIGICGRMTIALLLVALSTGGCQGRMAPAQDCYDDGDCSAEGLLQACVEGSCQSVDCLSSGDCPLGAHCADAACVSGCEGDGDCFSGQHCAAGSCVQSECRSTDLDCYAGQFCVDGTCVDAVDMGLSTCTACDSGDPFDMMLGDDGRPIGYESCGGEGAFCLVNSSGGPEYCTTACMANVDCPAAFECIDIVIIDTGEVIGANCIGPCDLM